MRISLVRSGPTRDLGPDPHVRVLQCYVEHGQRIFRPGYRVTKRLL